MSERLEDKALEDVRRSMVAQINEAKASREALVALHGQVWDTVEMSDAFEVLGFMAPFVGVVRKSDGRTGSLMFQHYPRFYFQWREDKP